jgi:hypothetical protein
MPHMREVVGSIPTATTIFDSVKNRPVLSFLETLSAIRGADTSR